MHDSEDLIEKEGIKRAWAEVSRADCVLLVIDITSEYAQNELHESIQTVLPPNVPIIRVYNKMDALSQQKIDKDSQAVYLSAQSGEGLDLLKARIKEVVGFQPTEGQFLARRRHLQALDDAKERLLSGYDQLVTFRAGELLAEELRLAHHALCEITGEFSSDDLLGKIFSSFCIGK